MKTQIGNTLQFAKIRLFLQSESMFYHKGRVWNLNEIWHLQKCNPLHFFSGTTNDMYLKLVRMLKNLRLFEKLW